MVLTKEKHRKQRNRTLVARQRLVQNLQGKRVGIEWLLGQTLHAYIVMSDFSLPGWRREHDVEVLDRVESD